MRYLLLSLALLVSNRAAAVCDVKLTEPLTEAKIQRELLGICKIHRARDIIAHLPDAYRSHFTFIRKSSSQRGACVSAEKSRYRIILFSPNSSTVIAMPWDPTFTDGVNCNNFETMELKDDDSNFTLLDHPFAPIFASGHPAEKSFGSGATSLSGCSSCHPFGLPNWAIYRTWKSTASQAVGGDDDFLHGPKEVSEYRVFYNRIHQDGSYRLLIWPKLNQADVSRLILGTKFERMAEHEFPLSSQKGLVPAGISRDDILREIRVVYALPPYRSLESESIHVSFNFSPKFRPNLLFTKVIANLNSRRLWNKLRFHSYLREIMYLQLFLSNCLDSADKSLVNVRLRSNLPKKILRRDRLKDDPIQSDPLGFLAGRGLLNSRDGTWYSIRVPSKEDGYYPTRIYEGLDYKHGEFLSKAFDLKEPSMARLFKEVTDGHENPFSFSEGFETVAEKFEILFLRAFEPELKTTLDRYADNYETFVDRQNTYENYKNLRPTKLGDFGEFCPIISSRLRSFLILSNGR